MTLLHLTAQEQALDLRLGDGLKYVDISSNILLGGPTVQALAAYEAKAQKVHALTRRENEALGKKSRVLGLVDLKMNGLSMVTTLALMEMWKACTSLQRFQMSVELSTTVLHRKSMMPHISDTILVEAQYFSLQEVSLSGCCLVSDAGVCSLIEKCHKQLKSINISYLNNVTDLTMYHLAEYCGPGLETLNVSGCNKITNNGVIALCTDNRPREVFVYGENSSIGNGSATNNMDSTRKLFGSEYLGDGIDEDPSSYGGSIASAVRSHKSNPSLDALNPFHQSPGCLKLKTLELNGNYRITDPGVVALSNLKEIVTLSIRNLDNVSDNPLLLMSQSCRHLKHLDISGLDLVSIEVVKAFATHCYKLETFTCELCNFTAGDYAEVVRPRLPLALPNGLHSKLDPRPRPILEYNRYVVETREMQRKAWVLTSFGIYCIAWGRLRRCKAARKQAIRTIGTVWFDYRNRHRLQALWGSKNARLRAANVLQV